MSEIEPPKPKSNSGRKRGIRSLAEKAKSVANRVLREQRKKISKSQTDLSNAKRKRDTVLKANDALNGKDSSVLNTDDVKLLSPTIQEHVKENIVFEPNKGPQTEFLAASEREVFYGGARGGGKSYAMLVDPLRYCHKDHHRGLLLRRSMPELRDMINHSQRLYPKAYPGAKWREQEKEWRFPSGARIEFGYAENLTDVLRYQVNHIRG